jgi:hypothetical protein
MTIGSDRGLRSLYTGSVVPCGSEFTAQTCEHHLDRL